MLAEEERRRLFALVDGSEQPNTGFELHFMRVIRGDAHPCSPKEREWVRVALSIGGGENASSGQLDDTLETLHSEIESRGVVIGQLQRELASLRQQNASQDLLVSQLNAKVSMLEKCLAECHKALARYERTPPPLVTDVQKDNERGLSRDRSMGSRMIVYSSTTGQD